MQELTTPEWVYPSGLGRRSRSGVGPRHDHGVLPNLIWSKDRGWVLTSEIDFDSKMIGGSRKPIVALIRQEDREMGEVPECTGLTINANSINPPAHT